jgi:putative membrane-bound dehydrogenase-like protein
MYLARSGWYINFVRALVWLLLAQVAPQDMEWVPEFGLRVARGFRVSLVSDHTVANDIYAMTLDAQGRVVVTSKGWIKRLVDRDADGRADEASLVAETPSGAMGLCFDGPDLLASTSEGLVRWRDADGDGRMDGPPEVILKLRFGEHGHHAMRKGPDGFWYLIAGNDAGVDAKAVMLPNSPVREPEAGALVRLTPDLRQSEVIAHGFRNPYDFDFNAAGDLFTYDSDCERDYLLPWYTPTRVYHIAYGMHHGWRLTGYLRSFARRDYYPDCVDILWPIGRGSPTGVVVYRHAALPERFRGGLFVLDWTFGRIWFLPLTPKGATYETKAEVFIEPIGTEGFAPTDIVVAPDGSLLVSIGGRGTRGAVFRVAWGGENPPQPPAPANDLEAVLTAPQPLDAWSRARWEPVARRLGAELFARGINDKSLSEASRVRAVEILTELFGGIPGKELDLAAHSDSAAVRARIGWSMGRARVQHSLDVLRALWPDDDSAVQRSALEALREHASSFDVSVAVGQSVPILTQKRAGKRVLQAAAGFEARLPGNRMRELFVPEADLAEAFGGARHYKFLPDRKLSTAITVLKNERWESLRFQSVRLIIVALGDCNLAKPPVEVQAYYSLPETPLLTPERRLEILKAVRPIFPSGDERTDLEASRLLAMLEDEAPETVHKAAAFVTPTSSATSDVHYLIVLSRLRAPYPPEIARRIGGALLGLTGKLAGQEMRPKQTWAARMAELLVAFGKKDSTILDEVLGHRDLVNPSHVELALAMDPFRRGRAARRFLDVVRDDEEFPWSEPLIRLLQYLPAEDVLPIFRAHWGNYALHDALLLQLSRAPDPIDRPKYGVGIESGNAEVARASMAALQKLPVDADPANLVPLLRLLRRLTLEPKESGPRRMALALIERQAGRAFDVKEEAADAPSLKRAYQPVFDWFAQAHPAQAAALEGGRERAVVEELLRTAPWDSGEASRGEAVFAARGCRTCHAAQGALGPSLVGVTRRFSREDLLAAIVDPSKDVAPPYRRTLFAMKDGRAVTGVIIFDSADGYIVQVDATTTVRVDTPDIASMHPVTQSIMPEGLLGDLSPGDVADLFAYLRSLER